MRDTFSRSCFRNCISSILRRTILVGKIFFVSQVELRPSCCPAAERVSLANFSTLSSSPRVLETRVDPCCYNAAVFLRNVDLSRISIVSIDLAGRVTFTRHGFRERSHVFPQEIGEDGRARRIEKTEEPERPIDKRVKRTYKPRGQMGWFCFFFFVFFFFLFESSGILASRPSVLTLPR